MRKALLATACLALFATQAQAAKCYIREYNTLGAAHGTPAQIAAEPAVTDQVTADFTSAPVQSSAFQLGTTFIRLWCDTQGSFLVGTNPTAANTNAPIAAGTPEYFSVPEGGLYKLSVHSNP
jgi:hypothetical protein